MATTNLLFREQVETAFALIAASSLTGECDYNLEHFEVR